jgi:FKBP-type peptidyl-prolyl cis-trans isomerase FklB
MKKLIIALIFLVSLSTNLTAQVQEVSKDISLKNAIDSLSYSFGFLIGNNLQTQGVKELNYDLFIKGFNSGFANEQPVMKIEECNTYVQDYFNKQITQEANMNLEKSAEFLIANQTKEGVVTLPSGLQYKILEPGEGTPPLATDQVRVHYTGTFIDGTVFDSSIERNEPIVFGVNQVIPGWTEALQLMRPGAKWMLYVPPALAYGEKGAGGVIGPNQALIFEVQLIEVIPGE